MEPQPFGLREPVSECLAVGLAKLFCEPVKLSLGVPKSQRVSESVCERLALDQPVGVGLPEQQSQRVRLAVIQHLAEPEPW